MASAPPTAFGYKGIDTLDIGALYGGLSTGPGPSGSPADTLAPFLGPPNDSGIPAHPKHTDDVVDRQLPEFYEGKNVYIPEIITGLTKMRDDFETNVLLPYVVTDQKHFSWSEWRFNSGYVHAVPHRGMSRMITSSKKQYRASMVRKGQAFMVEHGFQGTPDGRKHYYLSLMTIAQSIQETNNYDTMYSLFEFGMPQYEQRDGFQIPLATIVQSEIDNWAILQKDQDAFETLLVRLKRVIRRNAGKDPDVVVMPEMGRLFLTMCDPIQVQYRYAGPTGRTMFRRGPDALRSKQGLTIFEMRPYNIYENNGVEDLSVRIRSIGEYYLMEDPYKDEAHDYKDFKSKMVSIEVYDYENNVMATLEQSKAIYHCGRFNWKNAAAGWPPLEKEHADLIRRYSSTAAIPPEHLPYYGENKYAADPTVYENKEIGQHLIIEHLGDMELNYWTDGDTKNAATAIIGHMLEEGSVLSDLRSKWDKGLSVIRSIEAQTFEQAWFEEVQQAAAANGTTNTPKDLLERHGGQPQLEYRADESTGSIPLPSKTAGIDTLRAPAGYANLPGLRELAKKKYESGKGGWSAELVDGAADFIDIFDIFTSNLASALPNSIFLDPKNRPVNMQRADKATTLFHTLVMPPRLPIFLQGADGADTFTAAQASLNVFAAGAPVGEDVYNQFVNTHNDVFGQRFHSKTSRAGRPNLPSYAAYRDIMARTGAAAGDDGARASALYGLAESLVAFANQEGKRSEEKNAKLTNDIADTVALVTQKYAGVSKDDDAATGREKRVLIGNAYLYYAQTVLGGDADRVSDFKDAVDSSITTKDKKKQGEIINILQDAIARFQASGVPTTPATAADVLATFGLKQDTAGGPYSSAGNASTQYLRTPLTFSPALLKSISVNGGGTPSQTLIRPPHAIDNYDVPSTGAQEWARYTSYYGTDKNKDHPAIAPIGAHAQPLSQTRKFADIDFMVSLRQNSGRGQTRTASQAGFAGVGAQPGAKRFGGGSNPFQRHHGTFDPNYQTSAAAGHSVSMPSNKFFKINNENFRQRFHGADNSPDVLVRVVSQALCGAKYNGQTLVALHSANVPLPFSFMALRPNMMFEMASAIVMIAGSETGNFMLGNIVFEMGDDPVTQYHYGNMTGYFKAIVRQRRNVLKAADIFCRGYIGGAGVDVYESRDQFTGNGAHSRYDRRAQNEMHSLFYIMLPYRQPRAMSNIIDYTGHWQFKHYGKQVIAGGNFRDGADHAVGLAYAAFFWNWFNFMNHGGYVNPLEEHSYFENKNRVNTIACKGPYTRWNVGTGVRNLEIPGSGHMGPYAGPGLVTACNGPKVFPGNPKYGNDRAAARAR